MLLLHLEVIETVSEQFVRLPGVRQVVIALKYCKLMLLLLLEVIETVSEQFVRLPGVRQLHLR